MQVEASGHGYSAGREIRGLSDLLDKTGNIKLVATEAAQNALTNMQEFDWGDVFMRFDYQNKGGKLFANGRSIEEINDASEIGGDRMGRVINALDKMIADKNVGEAIVVSEDLGYGRHYIYRYRRGQGENIEGLAFEYQGTAEELGQVVSQLGKRAINRSEKEITNIADFSKPLFFTEENKNDVSDLSQAALNSYQTPERKMQMDTYLHRLKRDTDGYEGLEYRRQLQEKELEKQYEKLILKSENAKAGIAGAVYGMLNVAEKIVGQEDRRRKEETVKAFQHGLLLSRQYLQDIIRSFSHGLVAISGFIDHTGRLLDHRDTAGTIHASEINKTQGTKSPKVQLENNVIRQVIEPVATGIIGLSAAVTSVSDIEHTGDNEDGIGKLSITVTQNNTEQPDDVFWEKDKFVRMFPALYDKFLPVQTELQQGIEDILPFLGTSMDSEFKHKPQREMIKQRAVETNIVVLAEELIQILASGKDKLLLPIPEAFADLSFLINVYNDENSSKEVKQLLAVLIYKQIKIFTKDKKIVTQFPDLEETLDKFQRLVKQTGFLDAKFNLLFLYLTKHDPQNIFSGNKLRSADKGVVSKIISVILGKSKTQISVEKLSQLNNLAVANVFFLRQAVKKRQNTSIKQGIIYWFSNQVIYQYSSLLVTHTSV